MASVGQQIRRSYGGTIVTQRHRNFERFRQLLLWNALSFKKGTAPLTATKCKYFSDKFSSDWSISCKKKKIVNSTYPASRALPLKFQISPLMPSIFEFFSPSR
jgi:hypothetical protein